MYAAAAAAETINRDFIGLMVEVKNEAAIQLYERLGFQTTGFMMTNETRALFPD